MKQKLLLISFVLCLVLMGFASSNVSASSGVAAYYIGPGEFYTTELNGAEKYITSNNTTYTIFIPVRTLAEQQSFLNNTPVGVTTTHCPSLITDDRDGQQYPTVIIGSQCWMAKNLNYNTGSSWCYNDATANCDIYGRLYDWNTAVTACPTGWKLASHDEWTTLERFICTSDTCETDFPYDTTTLNFRGTDEGSKLSYYAPNGTNSSGFDAKLGGHRNTSLGYANINYSTMYWTATPRDSIAAWSRGIYSSTPTVQRQNAYAKSQGFSVRCLKE